MTDQDRPKHPRITAIEMEAERMKSRLQPTQAFRDQDRLPLPPRGGGSAAHNPDETKAFRDRVMIEVALKLVESGRFQNAIGGEGEAIARASADLAARLVEHRNND